MPKKADRYWTDLRYKALESYALTDKDIREALGTNVFLYPDLYKVQHLDELFDDKGRFVLLYLTKSQNQGHWVAMLKKGNTLEYFDSYGGHLPDTERQWLSQSKLRELNQDHPRFMELVANSGYKLSYNPYAYQDQTKHNNTCGRHVVARLYLHKLREKQYRNLIKRTGLDPDEFAIRVSYALLGK